MSKLVLVWPNFVATLQVSNISSCAPSDSTSKPKMAPHIFFMTSWSTTCVSYSVVFSKRQNVTREEELKNASTYLLSARVHEDRSGPADHSLVHQLVGSFAFFQANKSNIKDENTVWTFRNGSFYTLIPTTGQKLSEEISASHHEADEETITEGNCSRNNVLKSPRTELCHSQSLMSYGGWHI